jgi:hypothetical protein
MLAGTMVYAQYPNVMIGDSAMPEETTISINPKNTDP